MIKADRLKAIIMEKIYGMVNEDDNKDRYVVVPLIKLGLLYGYGVKDTKDGSIVYEYDEDEKHEAELRCELKNALYSDGD